MKNKKLKLADLKVQSFVTSMDTKEKQTIDGGVAVDSCQDPICNVAPNLPTPHLLESRPPHGCYLIFWK